jgi:hypothetical protein
VCQLQERSRRRRVRSIATYADTERHWAEPPLSRFTVPLLPRPHVLNLAGYLILFHIFVLNISAQPSNLREPVLRHTSARRTALELKFMVLAIFLVRTAASSVSRHREVEARTAPSAYPLTTREFIGFRRSLTTGMSCAKNVLLRKLPFGDVRLLKAKIPIAMGLLCSVCAWMGMALFETKWAIPRRAV